MVVLLTQVDLSFHQGWALGFFICAGIFQKVTEKVTEISTADALPLASISVLS